MARVKRHFSNEFKQEAVRLSYERENIKDLSDELGIEVARIYKWRTAERKTPAKVAPVKKSEHPEVKEFRKALKNAELELEILKKAVPIVLQERWEVYQFIAMNKENYSIKRMCRVLKVSRSCYYRWSTRSISN